MKETEVRKGEVFRVSYFIYYEFQSLVDQEEDDYRRDFVNFFYFRLTPSPCPPFEIRDITLVLFYYKRTI